MGDSYIFYNSVNTKMFPVKFFTIFFKMKIMFKLFIPKLLDCKSFYEPEADLSDVCCSC